MTALPVSVIVASRHRPNELLRCIASLRQQDHAASELVVVADPEAALRVGAMNLPVKLIPFDEANISAARNAGLAVAAGTVVAFIDDDAVAEPTWARRLTEPFADTRVAQAGGYVIGRNGFSWQWRAVEVDAKGQDHAMRLSDTVSLHTGSAERAVKTQGTNCAFLRSALLAAGGFDPAFRFYLDEADINLRLAARGGLTAIVPDAVVHHCFAASSRRRADRAPLDLQDIGASSAIFLRRHAPHEQASALARLRDDQRRRLLRMMIAGLVEPRDVDDLMATLELGIADGLSRNLGSIPPLLTAPPPFRPLGLSGSQQGVVLSGRPADALRLAAEARSAREAGDVVTVVTLSRGMRRHRMFFSQDGIWWQKGGQFGASERTDRPFRPWRFAARVAREAARLSRLRPINRQA